MQLALPVECLLLLGGPLLLDAFEEFFDLVQGIRSSLHLKRPGPGALPHNDDSWESIGIAWVQRPAPTVLIVLDLT